MTKWDIEFCGDKEHDAWRLVSPTGEADNDWWYGSAQEARAAADWRSATNYTNDTHRRDSMTTITITKDMALDAAKRAVELRGKDFVYRTDLPHPGLDLPFGFNCAYSVEPLDVRDGYRAEFEGQDRMPGCLVGLAFYLMDDRLLDWLENENENRLHNIFDRAFPMDRDYMSVTTTLSRTYDDLTVEIEAGALVLLQSAQDAQDGDTSWGNALARGMKDMQTHEESIAERRALN